MAESAASAAAAAAAAAAMSDAGSDRNRNLPTPTARPPSSQDSESSWTSTIDASPTSLSDSDFSESDDEEVLEAKGSVPTAEPPCEPIEAGHQIEDVLMVAKTVRASPRPPKEKGPGRPRKVANAAPGEPIKRNLRVKTGCHTCRKRKKKCDEAKPECENCTRNGYVCGGYPPKKFFLPGSGSANGKSDTVVVPHRLSRTPRHITPGIESDVDRRFLDHFAYHLSEVLTVHDNVSNPFQEIILRMAMEPDNQGLIHSVLSFSGLHLGGQEPNNAFTFRQIHHQGRALQFLKADVERRQECTDVARLSEIQDRMIATSIVLFLTDICRGSTGGEYRYHMTAIRRILGQHRSSNPEIQDFYSECFMFHEIWNLITSLRRRPPLRVDDQLDEAPSTFLLNPTRPAPPGVFVGVKDGLHNFIVQTSKLRHLIRQRRYRGMKPPVIYPFYSLYLQIEVALNEWNPIQEPHTSAWYFATFCQQCIWIYLCRTIKSSKPSDDLTAAVDEALEFLRMLDRTGSTQAVMLSPLFILGCAAFEPRQRAPIETAFDDIQAYSNLGNIRPAREVVRHVWKLMDAGDERSWDWEMIMADMGIDLLVT